MDLRLYDPAIARWNGIDPVTHHNFSPYSAFDNNPVFFADPSGADAQDSYGADGAALGPQQNLGGYTAAAQTNSLNIAGFGINGGETLVGTWTYDENSGYYQNNTTGEITTNWQRAIGETIATIANRQQTSPGNGITIRMKDAVTGEWMVVAKFLSQNYDMQIDIPVIAPASLKPDPWRNSAVIPSSITIPGFDAWLKSFEEIVGNLDAIHITGGFHAAVAAGTGASWDVVIFLTGSDAGKAVLYKPEEPHHMVGISGGVGFEIGAIHSFTENFNRFTVAGRGKAVTGGNGVLGATISAGVNHMFSFIPNYLSITVSSSLIQKGTIPSEFKRGAAGYSTYSGIWKILN